jgi:NAD+ synthase
VKTALEQINPAVGDFASNAANIVDFARRPQAAGAALISFPDLFVYCYPPRDPESSDTPVARLMPRGQ